MEKDKVVEEKMEGRQTSNETDLTLALADVAQWIEQQPANQRVTGSIPSQGTCLGYQQGPQ